MTIQSATPYLILRGQAERAIAMYERALGAKTESVQRFGDVDGSCPEARRNLIMHAALRIGDALIMLSDGPGVEASTNDGLVSIALDFDDLQQMASCFEALADGGRVIQPIFPAPWGSHFGVVRDALGIDWMFNGAAPN